MLSNNAIFECTMKTLTVRNLPAALAEALKREKQRRGTSLNQTVIELLEQGLGVTGPRSNGLAEMAGTWSEEDFSAFCDAVSVFDEVDQELWR
jgi:plasmid stability protein